MKDSFTGDGLYLLENEIINEAKIIENDKSKTL